MTLRCINTSTVTDARLKNSRRVDYTDIFLCHLAIGIWSGVWKAESLANLIGGIIMELPSICWTTISPMPQMQHEAEIVECRRNEAIAIPLLDHVVGFPLMQVDATRFAKHWFAKAVHAPIYKVIYFAGLTGRLGRRGLQL